MTDARLNTNITADNRDFIQKSIEAKQKVRELASSIKNEFGVAAREANSIASQSFRNTQREIYNTHKSASLLKDVFKGFFAAFSAGAIIEIFKNVAENIDNTIAAANKLDVGVASFQALSYAAKQSDVEIGTLETGLKKLRIAIANAPAGGKLAGIDVAELKKMDLVDAYQAVGKGINSIKDSYQQAAEAQKIFGKQGQEQLNLLRGGAAGYIAEFKNAKWGLSQEDISVFNQYDEATKRLSQTIQNDLQKAFITLLPAIMAAGNAFSAFVSGGSNFIKEMSRGISEGATEIRNIVVGEQAAQGFLSQTNRSTSRTTTSFQNAEGFSTTFRKKAAFISQAGFAGPSAGAVSATAGLNAAINNAQNQINVLNNSFNSLVNASNSAARSLDNMSKLKDLFGLNDQQSGSSYISNALKKKKQFSDPEFNSILNELSDFIGSGGSSTDSFFKNRIEKLKGLSGSFRLQQNLGLIDQNTTNTGMEAAIKAIENAAGNINKSQEVRVKISVDKSGVIQTVVDSDAFVRAVIDQAVAAADTSARAATR